MAIARAGRRLHPFEVGRQIAHHAGHRGDAERQRLQRIERALLVLLHVLRIGERQALHDDEQAGQRADDAARLAAHQFGGVGIALLRHDRRAGREASESATKPNCGVAQSTISSAKRRQVDGADRRGGEGFEHEIAIGHAVERIGGRPVEAERLRPCVARSIGKEVPASAAAPSGHSLSRLRASAKPAAVARQHFDIGEQMMAEASPAAPIADG